MPRRQERLLPRNSMSLYLNGLVDDDDASNSDGTPKYINDATATWEIRTAEYPGGTQVASGNAVPKGSGGQYRCDLPYSVGVAADSDYWIHVVITSGSLQIDISDSFQAISRTGRTPRS